MPQEPDTAAGAPAEVERMDGPVADLEQQSEAPAPEICVICQSPPTRPMRSHPCAHVLCAACLCTHLAHSSPPGRAPCPVCRRRIQRAEVADPEPGSWYLTLKHCNVTFHLDFRTENEAGTGVEHPQGRVSQLFGVPGPRLRLVHRGRVVPWDRESLLELSRTGATLLLVASRPNNGGAPGSGSSSSTPGALLSAAASEWLGATWWQLRITAESLWATALYPFAQAFRVFVESINPSWKPKTEDDRRRA